MATLTSWPSGAKLKSIVMNRDNKVVGDFLYLHTKANPRWRSFHDEYGNTVKYGGATDLDEVIVSIKPNCEGYLFPPLLDYLKHFVRRYGETLHTKGTKKFSQISITLPDVCTSHETCEVRVYTGASTEHSQQEIAYEIMATLSEVPILKAVAPRYACGGFIRKDKLMNAGPIKFFFASPRISVKFSYKNDSQPVVVSVYRHDDDSDKERILFQESMCRFLEEYVHTKTGQTFLRNETFRRYQALRSRTVVEVEINSHEFLTYTVSVPYHGSVIFPRVRFAEDVMMMLSRAFSVKV